MATETRRVRLILQGLASEGGHVPFSTFLQELQHLRAALRALDRSMSPSRRASANYRVVELHHDSPAVVGLESVPLTQREPPPEHIVLSFGRLLSAIDEESAEPGEYEPAVVRNLLQMSEPVGRSLAAAKLEVTGRTYDLSAAFRERGERLLEPEESHDGIIRGMLEAINIHEGANQFRIYPDIGPSRVSCHFPSDLGEIALGAVGRFVEVRGALYRKRLARFPHRAEVKIIEVYPLEEELPTLEDLRGVAPGMTGDLPAEDFVRQIRDARVQT
jgi:hypothetical protein